MIKVLGMLIIGMVLMACGPAKIPKFANIGANETAFVLSLEGNNLKKQKQFKSIEYLESMKVGAKRIELPLKKIKTGRLWFSFKYIPNVMVIKVDRAPVTREWTEEETQGTSSKNEALYMESKESIEFGIPLTVTAYVEEKNTSRFLYFYAGKQLDYIIDKNVRGFCQAKLSKQFSKHLLEQGRGMKSEFISSLLDSAKIFFAEKGITIEVIGAAGGLRYRDEAIQTAINEKFAAEIDEKKAVNVKNAAIEFAKAAEAQKKKIALEITLLDAQTRNLYAKAFHKEWDGKLPEKMVPVGTIPFFDSSK